MQGEEIKDLMEDLYKVLRDKIISKLGNSLTESQKNLLYSFNVDKDIIITASNKPVFYDPDQNKLIISDNFINDEYISKIRLRNEDYNLEELKSKLSEHKNVTTEELILFSKELNIKQIDIIKSLYLQEIMKMILLDDSLSLKSSVIMEGVIELIAHEIGIENDFIVSSYKVNMESLELAERIKNQIGKEYIELLANKDIDDVLSKIEDESLINKIEELVNDRKVLESTQDLDELSVSINEMFEEIPQVSLVEVDNKNLIKFIDEFDNPTLYEVKNKNQFMDIYKELKAKKNPGEKVTKEELKKALDILGREIPLYKEYEIKKDYLTHDEKNEAALATNEAKYESGKMYVNPEEGLYVKEAIVRIESDSEDGDINMQKKEEVPLDRTPQELAPVIEQSKPEKKEIEALTKEEFDELNQRFKENKCTYDELILMQKYIDSHSEVQEQKQDKPVTRSLNKNGKASVIVIILVILLTIVAGIAIGWLLYNIK